MTSLTTTRNNLSPALTPEQSEVVIASRGKKIKDMTDLAVKLDVNGALDNAFVNIKPKDIPSSNERVIMQAQIIKALYMNFSTLTMEEINLAVFKGSMGDFKTKPDEVVYITPKNVCDWIRAYVEQVKKDAIAKQLKWEAANEIKKEPTPEEQEEIVRQWVNVELIEKYKQSQKEGKLLVEDYHNLIYNYLTKRNIWVPSNEFKIEAYKKQREHLISYTRKRDLGRGDWFYFDQFCKEEFEKKLKIEKQGNKFFAQCVTKAKDQMIHDLLTGMLEMDIDIEEFLKVGANERK